MRKTFAACVAAFGVAASVFASPTRAQEKPFRVLVIDDLTGIYQGNGGPNTVLATTMAAEDFGGKVLGRKIEILSANHQNKPDIAAALAGRYIDQEGVSALVLGGSSSAGLAAQAIAKQRGVTTLVTGGYASNFVTDQCSPYGTQWAPSTDALANAVAKGLVDAGGKKWFFITADYVFGKALSADASKAVAAAGGAVVGEAKHPLDSPDMASQILQAQNSGADVVALANAGPDLVTTIKQAREFGMSSRLAALLVFTNNVVSMGLRRGSGDEIPRRLLLGPQRAIPRLGSALHGAQRQAGADHGSCARLCSDPTLPESCRQIRHGRREDDREGDPRNSDRWRNDLKRQNSGERPGGHGPDGR